MANEETTTRFKVDISQLKAQFQEAQRQIRLVNSEFKNATAGMDDWSKTSDGLSAKIKQMNGVLDSEKSKLASLKQQYALVVQQEGANSKSAQELAIKINNQEATVKNTEKSLKSYQEQLQKLQTSGATEFVEGITSSIKNVGSSIKDFVNNGISNLVGGLKTAGEQAKSSANGGFTVLKGVLVDLTSNAIQKATDSLVGFAKQSVETGKNFSSAMSQVSATMGITKDTVEDGTKPYEKLEAVAEECGATTRYSASQSAEALNYLALAGYNVDKACGVLPQTLNIASAGGMELADTVDMITDSMSALGIEATSDNLTTFGDQLAKTSQKSNTSMQDLGEAILTVGGTAKNLAGGTTEMNTALGILADAGTKGAEGGTALRNVILSLGTPTDVAKKKLDELGVKVYDANGNMRPLNETFKDLNSAMKNMTAEQKNDIISTVFNKTDIKSVNDLLANCTDRWDELSSEIENSNGACQQMADTMNDNLEGDLASLSSAIEGVQIKLSKQMEPTMRSTIQSFTDLIGKIDWQGVFDKIFQFKDSIVNTLTSYVIPVWETLKNKVSNAVEIIKGKIPLIKEKVEETIPVIVKKFNEFKNKFIEVKNTIVGLISTYILPIFNQLKESGVKIFDSLKNAIKTTDEPLVGLSDIFHNNIEPILNVVKDIIVGLISVIGNFISLLIDNKEVVISILAGIGAGFLTWNVATMIQGVISVISTLPAILTVVQGAMAGLNATISANPIGIIMAIIVAVIAYLVHLYNTSDEFRMLVQTIWDALKQFFTDVGDWLKNAWDFLEGFGAYMYDWVQEKKSQITNAVQSVWDFLFGFGEYLYDWVHVQIPQFFKDCWQSIQDTFSNVGNWFKETFDEAWENIKNVFASWGEFFSGLWDNIKNTFSALGTTLGDAIGGAVKSGINGVIQSIESTINSGIDTINSAINVINNIPGVSIGYMNGLSLPRLAKGGIVSSPTIAQIGEDGQEAVVPLQNNLGWLKTLASQLADELNSGVAFNNSTSSNVTNNFYQTNNSPKSLSRLEIYRQSKNLLSFKGG